MRGNLNDLKLIAATGPVQIEVTNADLIDDGWSAVPTVYIHSIDYKKLGAVDWDTDYQCAYTNGIVDNAMRNDLICDVTNALLTDNKSVLILVNRIAHAENILESMRTMPLPSPVTFVNGSSTMDERRSALERLSIEPVAVIATPIFDEGVDVPALDAVIMAGGGKSKWKLLQRLGRGLRRKEGENVVQIHDFDDYFNKYLDRHCAERIGVYVREGFRTEVIDHDVEVIE
jgi:superfamily II DNA or RNA helicase